MTRAPKVRAFFAVPLAGEPRDALARAIEVLRGRRGGDLVRWVRPENLHLTLRFLGDVEAEGIGALLGAVRDAVAGARACRCHLAGVRGFPSAARARVVAAGVEPESPLAALNERVEAAVVSRGVAAEPRRFRAHVTLGRALRAPLRGLDLDCPIAHPLLPVDRVVLYRSDLSPDGARYTSLGELPLGGGPPDEPSA